MRPQRGLPAFFLVLIAMSSFGLIVWSNARPAGTARTIIIPTQEIPTDNPKSWQVILQAGFGSNATPLPTIAIPAASFVPPTLSGSGGSDPTPFAPQQVLESSQSELLVVSTPTLSALTTSSDGSALPVTAQVVTRPPTEWNPPPLIPPLSRDPLGRDHYWFGRPVDSNGRNFELADYPFGSDGPLKDSPYRVHHGIDMPNPIGQTVRAAGGGTLIWAGPGFQDSPAYGNVVVIQHDFGHNGQPLFTLYAHLEAVLGVAGQQVNRGDPIGLIGNSGRVSGPHVHFEVRVGENRYRATYNPLLWMVPYVGHGVIAGRVVGPRGDLLQDQTVTIRDWRTGLVVQSITTYIYLDNGSDVNADPLWQENFVVGDIPVGRYEVIANIDGVRTSRLVEVLEGMTTFADLALEKPAAPTSTPDGG
jgi:murein DD-endopeptidase MepM/ murein hydrolase activator NlpD